MKKLCSCIIVVLLFQIVHFSSLCICQVNKDEKTIEYLNQASIDSLKKILGELEYSIGMLEKESLTQDSINEHETKVAIQNKDSILEINKILQNQKIVSTHGAVILLLGLFLEIIGAVLVSTENFTKETLIIRPYSKTEYRLGEWGGNKNLDNKNNSFQVFGTYILIIGFALQFIGTFFVVSQNFIFNIITILIAIIIITLLSYIIISKIGGLNFFNKLIISFRNIKGSFMFAFERKFQMNGKIVCEVCFNKIRADASHIGFIVFQDQRIMRPEGFFIGHKECVEKEIKIYEKLFWDSKYSIHIERLEDFFTKDFSDLEKLNEKDKQEKKPLNEEFSQIIVRLKILNKRIYKK